MLKKQANFRLSDEAAREIKLRAASRGVSQAQIVEEAFQPPVSTVQELTPEPIAVRVVGNTIEPPDTAESVQADSTSGEDGQRPREGFTSLPSGEGDVADAPPSSPGADDEAAFNKRVQALSRVMPESNAKRAAAKELLEELE